MSSGLYTVRDATAHDLESILRLLTFLTDAPLLPHAELVKIHEKRCASGIITKVAVEPTSGRVVGTASLLIEQKFTRSGMCVGHVEDVVTCESCRGKGAGLQLIQALLDVARANRCYKVILDCAERSIDFYKRKGFVLCERQMRIDIASHL